MPLLAAFLGGLVASVVAFFVEVIGRRLAIILLVVTALVSLATGFVALIQSAIASVAVAYPTGPAAYGLSLMPTNTGLCLGVLASAYVSAWVYEQSVRYLSLKAA